MVKRPLTLAAAVLVVPLSLADDYKSLDPKDLDCSLTLPKGQSISVSSKGKIAGTVSGLKCEGRDIPLETTEIRDGFVLTKQYGKLKLEHQLGSGLGLAVTSKQKGQLMQLKGLLRDVSASKSDKK